MNGIRLSLLISVYAAALLLYPSLAEGGPSAGLKPGDQVVGEVLSVDASKGELTIREDGSGLDRTVAAVNAEVLRDLKAGSRVRITIPEEGAPAGAFRG